VADLTPEAVLGLDQQAYTLRFKDPEFGLQLAKQLAIQNGYTGIPERRTEGSSLVFMLGPELYLKITPPFFEDSIEAEIAATKAVAHQRLGNAI
jgi:hypothetical protein